MRSKYLLAFFLHKPYLVIYIITDSSFIFYSIKTYRYISAVRLDSIQTEPPRSYTFREEYLKNMLKTLLHLHSLFPQIHIEFQYRKQTVKFVSTGCTYRNLKHILIFCQHIILDFHLIMR